jgi:hypothetical protein
MITILPIRPSATTTPPALVAVAVAARKTGDRDLERAAVRELREAHGIKLSFVRETPKAGNRG